MKMTIRIMRTYRSTSTKALLVLVEIPPINSHKKETAQIGKEERAMKVMNVKTIHFKKT